MLQTSPGIWGLPAAVIGAVVGVGMLIYKISDYLLKKNLDRQTAIDADRIVEAIRESLAPLTTRVERIDLAVQESRKICEQCYDMHDSYTPDGAPKWFVPSHLGVVLSDISRTCERLVETQQAMMETMQKMQDTQQIQAQLLAELRREMSSRP